MDSSSSDARSRGDSTNEFGTTRRAVLAAGGAVALAGLAGCSTLDGLLDRATEQVVGTTVSAPAAFYPGGSSSGSSASLAGSQISSDGAQFLSTVSTANSHAGSDERRVFRTGPGEIRRVPAMARADSREIELEGWSISAVTKAQDYNSSRSNKPNSEWWVDPDGDGDDDDEGGDVLVAILDVELELLGHVATARDAVDRRDRDEAKRALDAFVDTTTKALGPELDRCDTGVCETIRENSESRERGVRAASDAVDEGNWDAAGRELAAVDEIVLGDIERLDDALVERRPGRPKFANIVLYMRAEPTIGERFTVCLPDAILPGDRGSLAEELTPGRILAYCVASHEASGLRAPFHDRYGTQGISYDDDHCIQLDGPISLHRDIACGTFLSAELDSYRTENWGIVGYSTEGGAVVSGAPASADTDGKCVFVAADRTLREPEHLDSWGRERTVGDVSVTETLVCPVAVTPEDCPCPLPGLFYVRRCIHDDQCIYAGGWCLDEGALYEDSATLLFDEGPTEIASVTSEDVRGENFDARIVEQFSRGRSQHGSAVIVGDPDDGDGVPTALQSGEGRRGLNAVNVKVAGERGDNSDPIFIFHKKSVALDAPLVHLAGAGELSTEEKHDLIVPVAMDKGLR